MSVIVWLHESVHPARATHGIHVLCPDSPGNICDLVLRRLHLERGTVPRIDFTRTAGRRSAFPAGPWPRLAPVNRGLPERSRCQAGRHDDRSGTSAAVACPGVHRGVVPAHRDRLVPGDPPLRQRGHAEAVVHLVVATATQTVTVVPHERKITVLMLNSTNRKGIAGDTKKALIKRGFKITEPPQNDGLDLRRARAHPRCRRDPLRAQLARRRDVAAALPSARGAEGDRRLEPQGHRVPRR